MFDVVPQEKHVRHKVKANGSHPAEDPFGESDDNVKEIARRFEEKYVSFGGREAYRTASGVGFGVWDHLAETLCPTLLPFTSRGVVLQSHSKTYQHFIGFIDQCKKIEIPSRARCSSSSHRRII